MTPYIPHTDEDVKQMLDASGFSSIDDLFRDIPPNVRLSRPLDLPSGMTEYEVFRRVSELALKNGTGYVSFLGFGSYDHIIPSTVNHCISRSEFYTSYTPYQAEMSQGILQAIFEFQSMMAALTDLDVSNASLYDGATAVAEAASMALQSVRNSDTILYSGALHPFVRDVLISTYSHTHVKLVKVDTENGTTSFADLRNKLSPGVAGVIVQSPNVFGCIENYEGFADAVHGNGALFIISSNPMSLGILKTPGAWGADIAVGDVQPFGLPSCFGGPSAGYITARESLLRRMPGRIVGKTVDAEGRRAFVLTLQAREQHIKRERATSNICSNQALAALAATVYLSTVGRQGLREAASLCLKKARYLCSRLTSETGARQFSDAPFFNEFTLLLPEGTDGIRFQESMRKSGFFAGVSPGRFFPEYLNAVTIAVTEKRTVQELDDYVTAWKEAVK